MKYGFAIANGGPVANAEGIAALGAKGETLGFDLAYAVDRIARPKIIDLSNYPYSREFLMATGRGRADAGGPGAPVGTPSQGLKHDERGFSGVQDRFVHDLVDRI